VGRTSWALWGARVRCPLRARNSASLSCNPEKQDFDGLGICQRVWKATLVGWYHDAKAMDIFLFVLLLYLDQAICLPGCVNSVRRLARVALRREPKNITAELAALACTRRRRA
jgi:hypothetical protein